MQQMLPKVPPSVVPSHRRGYNRINRKAGGTRNNLGNKNKRKRECGNKKLGRKTCGKSSKNGSNILLGALVEIQQMEACLKQKWSEI